MTKAEKQRKCTLWTREKIAHLIQLYRQNECLWNHYTEKYKSKNVRIQAVASICDQLNVSKFDFGKKIHNLRNQFNSEMKKLERRVEEAGGKVPDKNQKCRWEHFESLMFLRPVIEPRPGGFQLNTTIPTKKMRFKYDYNSDEEAEHLMNQAESTAAVASLPVEENTEYTYEDAHDDGGDHMDAAITEDYQYVEATVSKIPDNPVSIREDVNNHDMYKGPVTKSAQIGNERVEALTIVQLPAATTITTTTSSNCGSGELPNSKTEDAKELQSVGSSNDTGNYSQLASNPNDLVVPTTNLPPLRNSTAISTTSNPSSERYSNSHSNEHNPCKSTTACSSRDQWDIFGELVASEFRNFNSDISRKKLKRKIMQAMLEVGDEDDHLNS